MAPEAIPIRWFKILLPLLLAVALSIYPRSYQAERGLNQSRPGGGRQASVLEADGLAAAADAFPWRTDLREKAGILYYQTASYSQAVLELSPLYDQGKLSYRGLVLLGDSYLQTNINEEAVKVWQAALKLPAASHADAFSRLETYYRKISDLQGLGKILAAHLQENPRNAEVLYLLGLVTLTDNSEKAAGFLNQAASIDPAYTKRIQTIESGILLSRQQMDRGYQLLLIGRALGSAGEWDFASVAAKSAVDLNPGYGDAHAFLGEALQQTGQDGSAEMQFAVKNSPDSVFVQGLEAVYWLRQEKPDQAMQSLERAAKQQPENPVWKAQMGEIQAMMGKLTDAAASYQQAAALDPSSPVYLQLLAMFSLRYNYQVGEIGLPAARRALLLDGNSAVSLDLMGQVFLALEDVISARRFFERAAAADPENPLPQLHLGSLLIQMGHLAEARPYLLVASKLQPDTSTAQQADRLLKQYYP